mmetsp:Transcript_16529/g.40400  ORF Transcript_16529/g.40400 Transcript_16529/m.40400 type:complete len:182 (-) Transcript_16529:342-887(-)
MMWYQRDNPKPTDLKRQRNEVLQMDVDQLGPPSSKRTKTEQVSQTQAASTSWYGSRYHYLEGENSPYSQLEDDPSIIPTICNQTNTLAVRHQQHQSTGQQSSERDFPAHPEEGRVGYQDMNSLLGSLHLSRRRQKAGEAGVHQNSAQLAEPSLVQKPEWQPPQPKSSQKKVVSLRIDSNLY